MRVSWLKDSCIIFETVQGSIIYNPDSRSLTRETQKDENTIIIFPREDLKSGLESKILATSSVIFESGEYEIKSIPIFGYPIKKIQSEPSFTTIFYFQSENMSVCIINDLNISIPASVSESMGNIDVLALVTTKDSSLESINSIIGSLDPSILIPVETESSLDGSIIYSKIITELGQTKEEPAGKVTINKSALSDTLRVLSLRQLS